MPGSSQPGMGVDAHGGAVIDPTKNVLDVVAAERRRHDDLRAAAEKHMEARLRAMENMAILRADHFQEMTRVHAQHDEQMHKAEQDRHHAIREIDVAARETEASRNLAAIQTLATQQANIAETLRAQVANTATTIANQLTQLFAESNKRLSALELSSSEGRGKQAVVDPAMAQLAASVDALVRSQERNTGRSGGIGATWGVMVSVALLAFAAGGLLLRALGK